MTAEKDVMTESIRYAMRQEQLVTSEQRAVLDTIIERLQSWAAFTVQEITPVWYTIECLGLKFQLEVDNPGGNLDIVEIPMGDEELKFPRKSWAEDSVKLWAGNESFGEKKIIAKFAILSD